MLEVQKYLQGQVVDGRYPLLEYLGATPHSSVFRTECDEAPHGQAALKLIPAPIGSSGAQLTRWRLAARFSHPALLRIFSMGRCTFEERAMLYVVMELAEENLAEILPLRCLTPGETDALLGPALEALRYLHGKGFVHGHLQPANILAIGDQVKLSSDSIARIGEAADPRDPGDPYGPPEIDLTASADIWALGITLVQCLTGRLPERDPQGRHAVSVPLDVPAPFLDLARHCLNPIPHRRWSVAQLQSALVPGASIAPSGSSTESSPESDSSPAPEPAPASAFVKPGAAAPVRRGFYVKKKYRLALAALAATAAAFVLGIVISGSGSDSTVTASAPFVTAVAHKDPAATARSKQHSATIDPRSDPSEGKQGSVKPKARDERAAGKRFARAPRSNPAVILSSVAPASAASISPSPASSNLIPGAVTRRALPRVPKSASDTIWGTVRVSVIVDVDPRGRVVEAKLDHAGPSRYFARLSMNAAPDWKFAPPRVSGKVVPSEWVIHFGYTNTGMSATASERHP